MAERWRGDTTVLTRLRVRGISSDPSAARLRAARLLDATPLHPPGLSPSAVVCIRRLADPLPGALPLWRNSARPPPAWERALAEALARLVRAAARPALGPVPANAEAVLFADRVELLACLASDWLHGNAGTRWWWQGLFPGTELGRALAVAWRDTPQYVPAALEQLAERGEVVLFARFLGAAEPRALLEGITHAFGLPELRATLEAIRNDAPRGDAAEVTIARTGDFNEPFLSTGGSPHADADRHGRAPPTRRAAHPVQPPWRRWVPESESAGLHPDAQLLVGVGLLLRRASTVARLPAFAQAVWQWHLEERSAEPRGWLEAPQERRTGPPSRSEDAATAGWSTNSPASDARTWASVSPTPSLDQAPTTPPEFLPASGYLDEEPSETPHVVERATESVRPLSKQTVSQTPWAKPTEPPSPTVSQTPWADLAELSSPILPAPPQTPVETELGGLFYLINLGLYLELYGDFTSPARPGIALPLWDFLTLLGRCLLGTHCQEDPVWSLLAHLASRAVEEPPGRYFAPPGDWRLPADWLRPFPAQGVWRWSAEGGRLRVMHSEAFCVLDVTRDADEPAAQLARETQSFGEAASFEFQLGHLPDPEDNPGPLDRWLGWLMPYVCARLRRALRLSPDEDLGRAVCVHRARVFVTAAHLDVVLALAELPLALRFAGLDRDPGWVPAAGRVVAFHFE